jgi:hypothetical protein
MIPSRVSQYLATGVGLGNLTFMSQEEFQSDFPLERSWGGRGRTRDAIKV